MKIKNSTILLEGEISMEIGNKILILRKQNNLSQEELAEKVGVSRQTISKWELGETNPDLKQAKLLSKTFNISLDELTDNETKEVILEKVSNTEKKTNTSLKILKYLGILVIIIVLIDIISLILFWSFSFIDKKVTNEEVIEIELMCSVNDNNYLISAATDGYFNCVNCPKEIQEDLKNTYIDFCDINKTYDNIKNYFDSISGNCE